MNIVLVGDSRFSRYVLEHLSDEHEISGLVISKGCNDNRASIFERFCRREDISLFETNNIEEVEEELSDLSTDIGVCAGWTEIIPRKVLDIPDLGFVGLHASPLPDGRGGAPVNWSFIQGKEQVSLSLFEFVEEVDAGDIVAQDSVDVEDRDDVSTVYDKITFLAFDLLDEGLGRIRSAGEVVGEPQDTRKATYRPQRKPKDGIIEWDREAEAIENWVKALTHPYPGAFTFVDGKKLTVWDARKSTIQDIGSFPGEVIRVDGTLTVSTGGGALDLLRLQPEGKPEMWGEDYANRFEIQPGDGFGRVEDYPGDWIYTGIRGSEGDFEFDVNYEAGETGVLTAVAFCGSEVSLSINCVVDGESMHSVDVHVDGWITETLNIPVENRGSLTAEISFSRDGETLDTRYMVLYGT